LRKTREEKSGQKKRVKIHEVTAENDIRYRGPLNCQHFQLLGWLCIVAAQAAAIIALGGRLDASVGERFGGLQNVLERFADMSLPFLLIANFARILNNSEGYKIQLLKNGAAMAGIALAAVLVMYRYAVGSASYLTETREEAQQLFLFAISLSGNNYGFLCFNIFVDLFLCTLVMFFLNYRPKRFFTGKARYIFRLFALIPIAYEIASIVLKILSANKTIVLPMWVFPLLTVKPPMTFALFIALAVFVKTREWRFRRHGKTHEEYREFLKTNRNSRNFSVFLAVMLLVTSLADLVIFIGSSAIQTAVSYEDSYQSTIGEKLTKATGSETALTDEEARAMLAEQGMTEEEYNEAELQAYAMSGTRAMLAVGFGESTNLFLLAPLVLLFSYTRIPRNKQLSIYIPIAAAGLIVLVYLEGFYQGLGRLTAKYGEELIQIIDVVP